MSENTADRGGSECTIGERLRYAASPDQNGWRVQLSPLMLEADAEITRLSTALAAAERTIAARDNEIKRWNESRDIFAGQTVELKSALLTEQAKCAVLGEALKECAASFILHEQHLGENKPIDYERIAREFVRRLQVADAALSTLRPPMREKETR